MCDPPLWLVENAFQFLASIQNSFDWIYVTGDIPPHDVWSETRESVVWNWGKEEGVIGGQYGIGTGKRVGYETGTGNSVDMGKARGYETGTGNSVDMGKGRGYETGTGNSVDMGKGRGMKLGQGIV